MRLGNKLMREGKSLLSTSMEIAKIREGKNRDMG